MQQIGALESLGMVQRRTPSTSQPRACETYLHKQAYARPTSSPTC